MASRKKSAGRKQGEVRLRGTRVPTLNPNLAIVRLAPLEKRRPATSEANGAKLMVRRAGKALGKIGISKMSIFRPQTGGKIFAYSADPFDATKIVQQSSDGTMRRGRVVGRKFKLA